MNGPSLSIIIATATRVESLRRLLKGLSRLDGREEIGHEILVANNAPGEESACTIEQIVETFIGLGDAHVRSVREPVVGKCRAQNRAIGQARGSILGFLDDDVEVKPQWLKAVAEFFDRYPFDAMQGPILMPPGMENDQEFLRVYHRYRTINFVHYGPEVKEIRTLTGGNMAIRKEVFARVGLFHEDLGPGRSGISEDVEFAQRMLASGSTIGYQPKASVVHEVDWNRLTEEFFRLRHEQQGRSRLLYKKQTLWTIIPNLARSILTFALYTLGRNERRKYRAKGRYYHYLAMVKEKARALGR